MPLARFSALRLWLWAGALLSAGGLCFWLLPSWHAAVLSVWQLFAGPDDAPRQALVERLGFWGPLALIGLMLLQAAVPLLPAAADVVLAGLLYGFWGGFAVVYTGTLLGAALGYALGRRWGTPLIHKLAGEALSSRLHDFAARRGAKAVLLVRLMPALKAEVMNLVAGASEMPFWPFMAASAAGALPSTALVVWLSATPQRLVWGTLGLSVLVGALAAWRWWRRHTGGLGRFPARPAQHSGTLPADLGKRYAHPFQENALMTTPPPSAYARAGVDIDAGHRAVDLMKGAVARTHGPQVLGGLGGFGGLFRAGFEHLSDPVLVASTDGVGTKTKVATRAGAYGGLGADIVNHCTNDILVQGARPLFFLDYVAMGQLVPEHVAAFVTGAAEACQALGVALLGGETAEMPGVYVTGELDIVGTIVGVVDRPALITGERLESGDVVIALPSSGLHTNGYSLARAALDGLDWDAPDPQLGGETLSQALLRPHRSYLAAYDALVAAGVDVKAMSHITGGGLLDNPPRVLPAHLGLSFDVSTYTVPPLFEKVVARSEMQRREAYRALNMGVGFLFMLSPQQRDLALSTLQQAGESPWVIGEVTPRQGEAVQLRGLSASTLPSSEGQ